MIARRYGCRIPKKAYSMQNTYKVCILIDPVVIEIMNLSENFEASKKGSAKMTWS